MESLMMNEEFEKRAAELGYNLRRKDDGQYVHPATQKVWKWFEAGTHWPMELSDPNFNMSYEG